MTEEMKNEIQTKHRRLSGRKENLPKCTVAAHAANVDDVADDEPHDPDSEPEEDTTEANLQDPNKQEKSSNDTAVCHKTTKQHNMSEGFESNK